MLEVIMKVQCGNCELHEQVIQPKEGIKDPKANLDREQTHSMTKLIKDVRMNRTCKLNMHLQRVSRSSVTMTHAGHGSITR